MKANTATIRELRTDFRSVKRRIEVHGAVVITDRGEPAFLLSPLRPPPPARPPPPRDYMGRMLRRQPRPLSDEEARQLWEEERGER